VEMSDVEISDAEEVLVSCSSHLKPVLQLVDEL